MNEDERVEFLSQCKWFYQERGDMGRYSDFRIEKLREADPALAHAYENYKASEEIFERMLDCVED